MSSVDGVDHTNNVEKVIWDNVPGTTATVIVHANAFTIPTSEQTFAVAWDIRSL
ncbi:hypothetical protein AYL99_10575 [Fonsecaea erecta]|uniref:Uncharacterized protein n=1 Tax=Fonsecaea erecta TaxID=1367422 RepID=A0A178Z745_9EURO|nr:hypothetical protein AYL99_10575 [Fonsecaea erecta]OAP54875.1 hypothetical protein AYL99_10575 [Fonsecaea erecta]